MQVTKAFISKKGNHICFVGSKEVQFGLTEDIVGFRQLADPSQAAERLAEIQANLGRFSFGDPVTSADGKVSYEIVIS